jgi:hypothetical protein
MGITTPSPCLFITEGLILLDYAEAEALADILEASFQPVNDPLDSGSKQMINDAGVRMYCYNWR